MLPTPYADVNVLLADLSARIRRILPAKLVGLYLFGSAATGDYDAGISDVDLLAAIRSDLDASEFAALSAMHDALADDRPEWTDRVEVLYKPVDGLQTFRAGDTPLTVISPGEPFHRIVSGREWLMNWYLVREARTALFGPPPAAVIPPITRAEFVDAVRDHALAYRRYVREARLRKQQGYAVLTLCRALYAHERGEHASKLQAARWGIQRLPSWRHLIEGAVAWRADWRDEGVDHAEHYEEALRFVEFVAAQIAAGRGEGTPPPV